MAGGVATSLLLWGLSGVFAWLPTFAAASSVIAFCAAVSARDVGWCEFWLPEMRRLVPRDVFRTGRVPGSALFGFQMGTGLLTYVSAGAPYVLALALLIGLPREAGLYILCGLGFGLGRALTPTLRVASRDGRCWDWRLGSQLTSVKLVALAGVAAAVIVTASSRI